jgi:fructokinase
MEILLDAIKKIAERKPDGFTIRVIPSLKFLKSGYIAAYLETQNCFGDEGLKKVLKHALEHEGIVGGWKNSENKQYYFDSSKVFDNLEDAIKFAGENKQIAIFYLNEQKQIWL